MDDQTNTALRFDDRNTVTIDARMQQQIVDDVSYRSYEDLRDSSDSDIPLLYIKEISNQGLAHLKFTEQLIAVSDLTKFDEEVLDLSIISSHFDSDKTMLGFAWNVVRFDTNEMEI